MVSWVEHASKRYAHSSTPAPHAHYFRVAFLLPVGTKVAAHAHLPPKISSGSIPLAEARAMCCSRQKRMCAVRDQLRRWAPGVAAPPIGRIATWTFRHFPGRPREERATIGLKGPRREMGSPQGTEVETRCLRTCAPRLPPSNPRAVCSTPGVEQRRLVISREAVRDRRTTLIS